MAKESNLYDNKTLFYSDLTISIKDIRFNTYLNFDKVYEVHASGIGMALVKSICLLGEDDYSNNIVGFNIWALEYHEHFQELYNTLQKETKLEITQSFMGLSFDKDLDESFNTKFMIEIYLPNILLNELKTIVENTEIEYVTLVSHFIDMGQENGSIVRDKVYVKPKEEKEIYNCLGFVKYINIATKPKILNYFCTGNMEEIDGIMGYDLQRIRNTEAEKEKQQLQNNQLKEDFDKDLTSPHKFLSDTQQKDNFKSLIIRRLDILIVTIFLVIIYALFIK